MNKIKVLIVDDSIFMRKALESLLSGEPDIEIVGLAKNGKEGVEMAIEIMPEWLANLDHEDLVFIKKFLLASGSLKEIAKQYGVTYPTVRLRLDKLIQKIKISEDAENEPYIALIKRLAVNDKLDFDTAKILIDEYKKIPKE